LKRATRFPASKKKLGAWPKRLKRRFYGNHGCNLMILLQLPPSAHTLLRPSLDKALCDDYLCWVASN